MRNCEPINGKSKMNKNILLALFALLLSVAPAAAQNCNPLPNQLTNGTTADANQVMANFNSLLTCVNNLQNNLQGYLGGLTLSNDPSSPNTIIDMAAGVAMSDDATTLMKTIAFTKNANAAWAVGSGNGCLDMGTALSASTWYHIFLIERTDTGVVDFLCSTSATNPVFPANYSKKRRIGSIKSDAASHILSFSQNGDEFLWSIPTMDVNFNSLGTSAVVFTLANVPSGVKVNAILSGVMQNPTASQILYISSLDQSDQPASSVFITAQNIAAATDGVIPFLSIRTNLSAQIRARASNAATILFLSVNGWIDTRGRLS